MADTPPATTAKPSGSTFGFLGKKVFGKVPVWVIAVVGVGGYYWYTHYGPGKKTGATVTDPAGNTCAALGSTGYCPNTPEEAAALAAASGADTGGTSGTVDTTGTGTSAGSGGGTSGGGGTDGGGTGSSGASGDTSSAAQPATTGTTPPPVVIPAAPPPPGHANAHAKHVAHERHLAEERADKAQAAHAAHVAHTAHLAHAKSKGAKT